MEHITYTDFTKVELRVGTVVQAELFPEARKPAYKLWIDFGDEVGVLKTSAQITHHYTPEWLIGTQVQAVTNFPAKQIGTFMSQCLVTWYSDEDGYIVLSRPEFPVPNGSKLH